jgi:hypothetical protein
MEAIMARKQPRTTTRKPAAKKTTISAAPSERVLWIGIGVGLLLMAAGAGAAFASKDMLKSAELAGTERAIASLNAEQTALREEAARGNVPGNLLRTEVNKISEQLDEAKRSLSELTRDRQGG